jgi:tape measure domain-containing protein
VAESTIKLIVDAAGAVSPLKRVTKETEKLDEAVRDVNGRLRDAKGRFIGAGTGAKKASFGFSSLTKTLVKAAAAYATFAVAQSAVSAGIQRVESERRLKSLSKGYGEVAALSKAAGEASERFGVSQTTANKAIAQVYARLRPVGVTLKDIVSTYNGFNTAARISGSTAEESSNAFTQLAQALGSGALRGDEFNSISEQVPGVLTAISKETGIAQGSLRKFAAEGGITADIVIRALKRIETEGASQLEDALKGPAQAIKDFQNATEEVQVALSQDIVPQLAESFRGLAELILNLKGPIEFIGQVAANTLNQLNSLIVAATSPGAVSARRDIKGGLLPLNVQGAAELFKGTGPQGKGLKGLQEESLELAALRGQNRKTVLLELMRNRLGTMDAPSEMPTLSAPSVSTLSLKNGKSGSGSAAKGLQDISAAMEALLLKQQQLKILDDEYGLSKLTTEIEIQKIMESNMQARQRNVAMTSAEADGVLRTASIFKKNFTEASEINAQITAQTIAGIKEGFAAAQEIDAELQAQAEKMNQLYSSIGQTITTGIVDSLTAAVDGTKSLAEVASNTLRSLANIMLKFGLQTFLGGLGGGDPSSIFTKLFGGGRASGGSVSSSKSYLVGERGPELFSPGRSGSIAPNGAMGGVNVGTINIQVENTGEQLTPAAQKQLAGQVQGIVLSTLANERRSGGML